MNPPPQEAVSNATAKSPHAVKLMDQRRRRGRDETKPIPSRPIMGKGIQQAYAQVPRFVFNAAAVALPLV